MYTRVSKFAKQIGYARETLYYWIRIGLIPDTCVLRAGSTISIDRDECMRLLRSGELARPKRKTMTGVGQAEDSRTLRGGAGGAFRPHCEHRFTDDGGTVAEDHPYSPEMRAAIR